MNYRRIVDLTERVVGVFIGAFVAVYLAAFAAGDADIAFLRDPGLFQKAEAAGVVASLALLKGLIGFRVGDKNTASMIPSNKPEEPEVEADPEPPVAVEAGPAAVPDPSTLFQYWYKEEGA